MADIHELLAENKRLREANRRLQAEGPALERDKLVLGLRAQLTTVSEERDEARAAARGLSGSRSNIIHQLNDAEMRLGAEQLRAGRLSARAEQAEAWFVEAKECVESAIDTDDESERGIQLHMAASKLWRGLCALRGVGRKTEEELKGGERNGD